MISALFSNGGDALLGRPRPNAAKCIVPIRAARTTETGRPLIKAYIQMADSGSVDTSAVGVPGPTPTFRSQ